MQYVDLVIRARDWQDGHFKVEVTASPMDRMREPEVVSQKATVARRLRSVERKQIPAAELRALGSDLSAMLLPGTVREMLFASLASLETGQGLRLRLVLDDLRVANLPWEYLYLPPAANADGPNGFLALDPRISMVRHEAIPMAPGSVAAQLPLKLVVGFAAPSQFPWLDLWAEREHIETALAGVEGVEIGFVEHLTIERLEAGCQGAHMFHFAGHGSFIWQDGSQTAGNGTIYLEDDRGDTLPFAVDRLALTLRRAGVRVVLLGGCETGRRDGVNAWSGIAPALMHVGIPAAVAMQYAIYDDAAIAFARRFYQALAVGLSLDEAVTAGRLAILNCGRRDDVEWGVPVLYMRSGDGVIFPEVTIDPSLEPARHRERVCVTQRVKELRDRLTGVEVADAPASGVDVCQEIATIEPGGEAFGARIDHLEAGVIRTDQHVDWVGPNGRLTGVSVKRLGSRD
jgi:hypothetical protein